jgi:hypothetical protein
LLSSSRPAWLSVMLVLFVSASPRERFIPPRVALRVRPLRALSLGLAPLAGGSAEELDRPPRGTRRGKPGPAPTLPRRGRGSPRHLRSDGDARALDRRRAPPDTSARAARPAGARCARAQCDLLMLFFVAELPRGGREGYSAS